jgi:Ni/Fe-hydrogenase subunit HybB-like protein
MEGYVFPNELHVIWGLTIVVYPYITGLVAGAFIVSSLYHVFDVAPLKVVARFSLLTALAFLLICALPLLLHLGRPDMRCS